jgi:hypothetical protein
LTKDADPKIQITMQREEDTPPEGAHAAGRLALRRKSDWWVAFFAPPDSMKGAIELGRMPIAALHSERGDAHKAAFLALMAAIVEDVLRAVITKKMKQMKR